MFLVQKYLLYCISAKNIRNFSLKLELLVSDCTCVYSIDFCKTTCVHKIRKWNQSTRCSSFQTVFSNRFLGCWLSGSEELLSGQPCRQRLRPGGSVCCLQDLMMLVTVCVVVVWLNHNILASPTTGLIAVKASVHLSSGESASLIFPDFFWLTGTIRYQ